MVEEIHLHTFISVDDLQVTEPATITRDAGGRIENVRCVYQSIITDTPFTWDTLNNEATPGTPTIIDRP